jgi:hypothetical protein
MKSPSKPEAAFRAAVLVLLVLPLLVMFGVATLVGVVADAGLQDETGRLFLAAFVV